MIFQFSVPTQGDEAAAAGADDADDVWAEGDLGVPRGGQALRVGGDGGGAAGVSLRGWESIALCMQVARRLGFKFLHAAQGLP